MRFITHATWVHLECRSAIGWLEVNGNDSHLMCFIRAVDCEFKLDRTVTFKLPYKLRCLRDCKGFENNLSKSNCLDTKFLESLYPNCF